MVNYLLLACFTVMIAAGQLLFKRVGLSMSGQSPVEGFLAVARSPTLYAALALYGMATLLWIWILSRVPLSQAYPWVALSIATVPLLAWFVWDEQVGYSYWVGIGLVMAGVFLTQYTSGGP
jgi:drug/metabolite transporter (DMT)-like permease